MFIELGFVSKFPITKRLSQRSQNYSQIRSLGICSLTGWGGCVSTWPRLHGAFASDFEDEMSARYVAYAEHEAHLADV